ncbi:pirin family protein [Gallaecimonas mangrovi]|uniref:pirin family protein n=1 Tax=Gallaecimonas mangrovi TaxID=2291597 RepID=UPI001D02E1FB|nr:pirin family protein [Gallaecimonas mangrovi]
MSNNDTLTLQGSTPPERANYPITSRQLNPGLMVARALPHRQLRLIGPWCFLDRLGPLVVTDDHNLDVAPHPHIGLQTVTWLLEGAIRHRDTLGVEQLIKPGQLNLMTAGSGIAHSEEGLTPVGDRLFGVQFWVALPEEERHRPATFEHVAVLPSLTEGGVTLRLFAGQYGQLRSPAHYFSPLFGAEIQGTGHFVQTLTPSFEYGLLLVKGEATVDGEAMSSEQLYYFGTGHQQLTLVLKDAVVICLGGEPFAEDIVMWWNFVARNTDEIAKARSRWSAGDFGQVSHYPGLPIPAPLLQGQLKAGR